MSGPFAAHGKQIKHGIDLYLAEHDNMLGGRKVKLIVKDDTGMAPQVAKRVAQELLVNSDLTIKQIARESGFASVQYMTRVFRASIGETPALYRRNRMKPR